LRLLTGVLSLARKFPATMSREFAFEEQRISPLTRTNNFPAGRRDKARYWLSQHDGSFFGPARNALQTHACREQALLV
jgi:hypothetical protein